MKKRMPILVHIDANRINAKNKSDAMNKLEKWHEDGVIILEMSRTAQEEAAKGSKNRRRKAYGLIFTETVANTAEEQKVIRSIEMILFPNGIKNQNEKNDVDIVFNAYKYADILVTADGGSKRQPGGILGNAEALLKHGLKIMSDYDAVAYIEKLITRKCQS